MIFNKFEKIFSSKSFIFISVKLVKNYKYLIYYLLHAFYYIEH